MAKDLTITERIWKSFSYLFILVLVVLLTILMASSGPAAFMEFLSGRMSNDYAEIYGEEVSDAYFQAVVRNYCSSSSYNSVAARISCADSAIKYIKESSKIAEELDLHFSERFLKTGAYKSIKEQVEKERNTRVDLIGKSDEEIDDIIRNEFEAYWSSSPVEFKEDQALLGNYNQPGYLYAFLSLAGMASTDDYKTEEMAKQAVISMKVITVSNSKILKELDSKVTATEAEIQAEFKKKLENWEKSQQKKDEKKADDKKTAPAPAAKKPVLDKNERKRLTNIIKSRKKQNQLKQIKDKLTELEKNKKLSLAAVATATGQKVFTVKDLDLLSIDSFKSEELNPTQQTYALGKNDQFADAFFSSPVGKTTGPINVDGNQYYIEVTARKIPDKVEAPADPKHDLVEERANFAWGKQNLVKLEALKKIMKDRMEYLRYRELPEAQQQPSLPGGGLPMP